MVESRQPEVLAIIAVFTVLAFIFVLVRLWSRVLGRNFGWDDHLIVMAMALLLGQTIATWKYILLSGTGYHMRDLPKQSIPEQLTATYWNFAVQMLYHPLMCLVRASIIMFLFRMKDSRRRIRCSLHVVFWLNIIYAVGASLVNILQCDPVHYIWSKPAMDHLSPTNKLMPGGTCINSRSFILTSCALSIFMDLIIIPIPSIMVWNLKMERKTKTLVVIVMSLGWIATAVSIGRFIVYYYRFGPSNTDRTWNIGIAISIAEPAVHIMTACAPATKCLFRSLFPYFDRSRTPAYYEERHTTNASKGLGSRGFSSGLSANQTEKGEVDDIGARMAREEGLGYGGASGVKRISSESGKSVDGGCDGGHGVVGKESVEAKSLMKKGSTRTKETVVGEVVGAEPKHCLVEAK